MIICLIRKEKQIQRFFFCLIICSDDSLRWFIFVLSSNLIFFFFFFSLLFNIYKYKREDKREKLFRYRTVPIEDLNRIRTLKVFFVLSKRIFLLMFISNHYLFFSGNTTLKKKCVVPNHFVSKIKTLRKIS